LSTFAIITEGKQELSVEKVRSTKKNLMEVSGFAPIDSHVSAEKKRELKQRNKENSKQEL
jgi:hypothetical protein